MRNAAGQQKAACGLLINKGKGSRNSIFHKNLIEKNTGFVILIVHKEFGGVQNV